MIPAARTVLCRRDLATGRRTGFQVAAAPGRCARAAKRAASSSRSAFGVAQIPLGACVEIEMIVEVA